MTEPLALERNRLAVLRDLVERGLEELLPDAGDPPHRLHAAMRYAVLSPGKRIRPILALLSAQQLGCPLADVLPAACALEMIHSASLVLDDLPCMDDADTRRGQPSVHVRYGEDVAVLTGVALLNEAFAVVSRAPHLNDAAKVAMTALLSRTVGTGGLIGGQDKDLRAAPEPTLGFLSQLHHEKTGVLFIAAVEVGALAAGASPGAVQALRVFARELGLAFQAFDDLDDEADLEAGRAGVNMLSVLGRDALRDEAARRLSDAKAALVEGGPELAPLGGYVDLLFRRATA
ncbi:polyprenyl synthetase family protein [Phenylobacterium sp.]|uniref:polyprenyl synthetase family protein n=1 Tax=Phenylobacterium sp. TaxID=1871053 RepID=UPI0035B10D3C